MELYKNLQTHLQLVVLQLPLLQILVTGDVINFIQILRSVLDLGVPSDATVSTAKIVDNAVTLAKMASGTDGNIISYDTW